MIKMGIKCEILVEVDILELEKTVAETSLQRKSNIIRGLIFTAVLR